MTAGQRWSADDRFEEAADCIEEAQEHRHFDHYARIVGELPLLLSRHGLGQTLAYLLMRGSGRETSPHLLVYQQITQRLAQCFRVTHRDLLTYLTGVDSHRYLLMAEEARLFALAWLDEVEARAYVRANEEA